VSRPAEERIFVGVLRVEVRVPGARSLKDRRQVVSSLRDRMRHRFDISFHEVGVGEDPQYQTFVVTTSGNDAQKIRSVLDQCAGMVRDHQVAEPTQVDVDVFRWQPPEGSWAERMMAELGSREGGGTDE
jgi:uncharacterized protein YlxP (DUF503 family)